MERATLGSGSDGGGGGEVELGAIVVDVDEFWAQEETVGEFLACVFFLKAWAMQKSVPTVLCHTIHRDAQ